MIIKSGHGFLATVGILLLAVAITPPALATNIPIGVAANYAVLYEGTGGHNLQITNVAIGGNVGVGGTGKVQDSGPSDITGRLDFSAANTGQFSNSNPGNSGPTSVNYGVTDVGNALATVNLLSANLAAAAGNGLALSGTQTVNQSAGMLDTINGVSYYVFNVTSYSANDGNVLTVNGNGTGDPVLFNFLYNSNVNLGGDVVLNGLSTDQVLFNFGTSGKNVSLNNNGSSFPLPDAFMGIILAPNDGLSLVNANLDGRVFGGDSSDMQIVSGDRINITPVTPPPPVPEPMTLVLFGSGVAALLVKKGLGKA